MSTASNVEQEMLALINDERTSRGLNPLQLETRLNASSEDHSEWMLDTDVFSHTGSGGSSATQRMEDAGFDFSGSWRSGENIAWQSERGAPGISDDVAQLHQNLMNSPGHRANILNPDYEYIGIGIETGDMQGFDAVMVTQNFATTDGMVALDDGSTPDATPAEPQIAEEAETPSVAEEPEAPAMPETPDVAEEPDTPTGPEVAEEPQSPTEPETPEVAEVPGTPTEPEAVEGPETSDEPEVAEQPETPEPLVEETFDVAAFLTVIETFVNEVLALVDDFDWVDLELPNVQLTSDDVPEDNLIQLPEPDGDGTPSEPSVNITDDNDVMVFAPFEPDCIYDAA